MLVYFLCQANQNKNISNIIIEQWTGATGKGPITSEVSTGVVALRNVQPRLSPLGDLIIKGFEAVEDFVAEHWKGRSGIQIVEHTDLWAEEFVGCSQKFQRYGDCVQKTDTLQEFGLKQEMNYYREKAYLFDGLSFMEQLRNSSEKIDKKPFEIRGLDKKDGLWTAWDSNGHRGDYDQVVLCLGVGRLPDLVLEEERALDALKAEKSSLGGYIEVPYALKSSFSAVINGINIVGLKGRQALKIGNLNLMTESKILGVSELNNRLDQLLRVFDRRIDSGRRKYYFGTRSKRSKRMPIAREIDHKLYLFSGLYKNGYLLAPYLASKLSGEILNNSNDRIN
jgi:hypothetical protein